MVETTPRIRHLFAVDHRFWGELGPEDPVQVTRGRAKKISEWAKSELQNNQSIYIIGSSEEGGHAIYFLGRNKVQQLSLSYPRKKNLIATNFKFKISFFPRNKKLVAKIESEGLNFTFNVFGILKQEGRKIKIIADFVPQEGKHPRPTLEAKKLIRLS